GIMIIGALFSCLMLRMFDDSGFGQEHPQLAMFFAILVAALSGGIFSLLLAFTSIQLKADQTIGGTALNMMAPAFAVGLSWAVQGPGQTTSLIPTWIRI
ncbi:MAG: ABC transporter permease, partial [Lachnospiraceae bacterium]